MAVTRKAEVTWTGDLLKGSGTFKVGSGALPESAVSWAARTEAPGGKTSPEELLAAAHASCLSMALSAGLARMGKPPGRLHVTATCTFDKVGDAWRVTAMNLEVRGQVPGLDAAGFKEAVDRAKDGCPISNALKGNVALTATAHLE
jgi:osmotically inducible protein OsmC